MANAIARYTVHQCDGYRNMQMYSYTQKRVTEKKHEILYNK